MQYHKIYINTTQNSIIHYNKISNTTMINICKIQEITEIQEMSIIQEMLQSNTIKRIQYIRINTHTINTQVQETQNTKHKFKYYKNTRT